MGGHVIVEVSEDTKDLEALTFRTQPYRKSHCVTLFCIIDVTRGG